MATLGFLTALTPLNLCQSKGIGILLQSRVFEALFVCADKIKQTDLLVAKKYLTLHGMLRLTTDNHCLVVTYELV